MILQLKIENLNDRYAFSNTIFLDKKLALNLNIYPFDFYNKRIKLNSEGQLNTLKKQLNLWKSLGHIDYTLNLDKKS